MQSLQVRQKWIKEKRDLVVNDIVLIKDLTLPRNRWRLGWVTKAHKADDGKVRRVDLMVGDPELDSKGKRVHPTVQLSRPIHGLVLLIEAGEPPGSPNQEPQDFPAE